jgi:hypothetical protein
MGSTSEQGISAKDIEVSGAGRFFRAPALPDRHRCPPRFALWSTLAEFGSTVKLMAEELALQARAFDPHRSPRRSALWGCSARFNSGNLI